ncbi:MAG: hypothetical protein ACTHJR_01635 [Sphingomonas sp.]|uniref:hypothetical protein n=1 Tax=Sphingomonas sp. TaxID=28214 RepID=UPI003F81285E
MIANLLIAAALNAAAPGIQTADVPRCSATVTDECMEVRAPAHRGKMMHHRKKHHKRSK